MKFANKLFVMTSVVLTVIFTIFGIYLLSSYFSKTLDREMEQAGEESRMFQLLFEMTYQPLTEYGEEYAIQSAVDSVISGVEKNGSRCFVWTKARQYYGDIAHGQQWEAMGNMTEELKDENNYACGIRHLDSRYVVLSLSEVQTAEGIVYLGISRDITTLYDNRQNLLNQYRLALILLVFVGGVSIFILSRYITRPIRTLNEVVEQIAGGNYESRSTYSSEDEIGKLSDNFNHMADRLVEQMHEKETLARQQESFTTAFAHELKTPLTSIIGYADMLNSIAMTEEERREAYYYIYTQGKRLENLSHKLLELVSVDRTEFAARPVQTKELEQYIRETMRPVFAKKHIKGRITLEKGIVYGDKDLLLSVLYNLLDNAVKASQEGGFVVMKGTCLDQSYEIKVVDNGRGIPPEEIHRITEAFYMVDKSRSRREGGAGIGMALCQKIVALHNGILRIFSNPGEGTVVQLLFPPEPENSRNPKF